ncbi:MAG TPA: acyltransferase [Ramlibacter sp.]|nr:acyltransferase [Ramlibacter sp.]
MSPAAGPRSSANRFEALDGWRGICACLVVLFHFHGFSPIYSSPLVRNSYLFVDFFFVLSGFVIAWNYATRLGTWPEVRRFLVLRVGRVYPLHAFMLFCFLAFETAKMFGGADRASAFTGEMQPAAVLSNLFLVQSLHLHDSLTWNGPAWSISTEVWTYVLFALLCVTLGLRQWVLAVAAIIPPLALLYLSDTGMDVTFDWGLLRCIVGFALGVVCYQVHRRRTLSAAPTPGPTHPMLATLVEVLAVLAVVLFVSAADKSALSLLAPFIFAAAVLIFASESGWVSQLFRTAPLRWLGTLSYSIYLTHFFIVLLLPKAIKAVFHVDLWTPMQLASGQFVQAYGRNNLEGTLFFGLALAITIAFSALTYRWIETPGRDWSRRFAGRANSLNGPYATAPSQAVADAKSISTSTARRA